MEVKVEGVGRLIAKLQKLGVGSDATVLRGMKKGAKLVQADAKRNVHVASGQLRNGITVEQVGPLTVGVGTNVEHAVFEELGTGRQGDPRVSHTSKERWSYQDSDGNWHTTSGHEPHPFLGPALTSNRAEVKETVAKELRDKIREVSHG